MSEPEAEAVSERPLPAASAEILAKYEDEVAKFSAVSGMDPERFPIKWIKWETLLKGADGIRAPIWRQDQGDIGYILASLHEPGVIFILVRNDGTCCQLGGYAVDRERQEGDSVDYTVKGEPCESLRSLLTSLSEIFANSIDEALRAGREAKADDLTDQQTLLQNELVSLPQPVLILQPPVSDEGTEGEAAVAEDDDPVVPYPRQLPSDNEYWAITKTMKDFVRHAADPMDHTLQDVAANPALGEVVGQRAILDAGALPAILDVLRIRQAQHTADSAQAVAAVQILAQISLSPNVRRTLANADSVKILLSILKKEEKPLMDDLFRTIANCCKNTKFRDLLIQHDGVEPLIYQIKNPSSASKVCYVLWTLNRSEASTKVLVKTHVLSELANHLQNPEKVGEELMLNVTRLLHSLAQYDHDQAESLTAHQIAFFCHGLQSSNSDLVAWCAKAFQIFRIPEEQQKKFMLPGCEGPMRLVRTLDSKEVPVVLAGLEAIAVVSRSKEICNRVVNSTGILSRMQNLWKHDDIAVRKGTIKTLGVLTGEQKCAQWTIKQNLMPDLLAYLRQTDPEFVIYSAKAIGCCCSEKENLARLMEQNGVRTLWSLMKSPVSAVQAAATRALVPFLKSPESPSIVRTFVDGLELLVNLLKSNDPDVQASACMAITEVAKDRENLAVMTDLGVVELLSRLLATKDDSVRKPLADAIGVCANWANNRRRFGEEGAIDPLVSYLRPPSTNKEVHAATAKALKALSEDPENSNNLRHAGVVDYLLVMVESKDTDLQMAAAVAIRNIRTNCVKTDTSDRL